VKLLKKIQYNSPVILTFALLSLAILFLGYYTGGYSDSSTNCYNSSNRSSGNSDS